MTCFCFYCIYLSIDGTKLYTSGGSANKIYNVILNKPWDITNGLIFDTLFTQSLSKGLYYYNNNVNSKLYSVSTTGIRTYIFNSSINFTLSDKTWAATTETWATASIVVPYKAPLDTTPSLTWSQNTTTTPTINTAVTHSVLWNTANNGTLAGYTFSWCNGTGTGCSGTFVNDSYVALGGTANWTNVSKTLGPTPSIPYSWKIYVNTTGGLANVTDTFTYTSLNAVTDTCTYTSGTWYIDINDNCTLSTQTINAPIVVNGSNGILTINGSVLCKNLSFVPGTFNGNFIVRVLSGKTFGTYK